MALKVISLNEASSRFLSLIYGQPGSGKTYGASTLDGRTLIIDFDRGTSAIPKELGSKIDVVQPSSYEELMGYMYDIESSDYDNIVLDTISAIQGKLISNYTPPISQKDWGVIGSKIIKIVDKLDYISTKGKNVIIIAQEKIINEDDPKTIMSTVDLLPSVRTHITASARVIGRTTFKDGEFMINVNPHPRRITKLSVHGVDTEGIKSFKHMLERIEGK